MSILSACIWCKWANKLKGPQCKNWPCGATIISSTSTLGYFGARDAFLTIVLKNNHDINIKSKMAACTSHNRKGNCGILSKWCSYKGIMKIIIFYIFWDKEHHFWKKNIKAINIYMLYSSIWLTIISISYGKMYQQLWTVHDIPLQLHLQILCCKFFLLLCSCMHYLN